MSFLSSDGLETSYSGESHSSDAFSAGSGYRTGPVFPPIIEAKLRRPASDDGPVQERLIEFLQRSIQNHSATLLVGRAGSGKTSLAAAFASRVPDTAWYSLDAGDSDWNAFSRHFGAVLCGLNRKARVRTAEIAVATPLELFGNVTARLELNSAEWPSLLVLDGIHHLYDSDWFTEFFDLMIRSLSRPSHVLILSRSKPPNPLWRLRSKQVLNVVDEKLLAFSASEAEELFKRGGLTSREGKLAHRESFGQAGKLIRILESKRKEPQA